MTPSSSTRLALLLAVLLPITLALVACPRVFSIDYRPENPFTGQGKVHVEPFEYLPAEQNGIRTKEVETNPEGLGRLFMSKDIGVLFADALQAELSHSGYEVGPGERRVLSGSIHRFYLNWVSDVRQTFEIEVVYTIRDGETVLYSQSAKSVQSGAKTMTVGMKLITAGMRDCHRQFIEAAQNAGAL